MSLQSQLDSLTAKLRAMVPAERLAVVDQLSDDLAKRCLHGGPCTQSRRSRSNFELPNSDGMLSDACFAVGQLVMHSIADAGALTAMPSSQH